MTDHRVPGVQHFDVRSEGPVLPWLRLMVGSGKISHYSIVEDDDDAVTRLLLHWTSRPYDGGPSPTPFIGTTSVGGRWVGPGIEMIAASIEAFLGAVDYGPRPPTDGSTSRGWRLSNDRCFGGVELFVEPHWQEYGQ